VPILRPAHNKGLFKGGSIMIDDDITAQPVPAHHRKAVEISRSSFEKVFNAIIEILSEKKEIKYNDLYRAVAVKLQTPVDDSTPVYTAAIKQYMEHQGIIKTVLMKDHEYLRLIQ
jgi:hypothetical protein